MEQIQGTLLDLRDEAYRDFTAGLLPTVDRQTILGVRLPALRRLARELSQTGAAAAFLTELPHRYYEENNLHAILISQTRDYDAALERTEAFLPFVDNWATCDTLRPKALYTDRVLPEVRRWLATDREYTVRFGIGILLSGFLDARFDPAQLDWVASLRSDAYYIRMMAAWYVATALAKQPEAALPVLEQRRLDRWTHNKAIQKAVESLRIDEERKAYLRTLRRGTEERE